ncbi:MAG: translocation protein TolB, partial [Saprospiraceae bacterium]|nr:PD40 domain-containing protein [Bacteroidia bacterium]NNL91748.1 translocation protein TolB [Saprospiraceae bacterium]
MKSLIIIFTITTLLGCDGPNKNKKASAINMDEPSGTIAFTSSRDGNAEIYTVNADGTDLRNITNHPSFEYSTSGSPNGKFVAFYSNRDGNSEIYLSNTDGTDVKRLTDHPAKDVLPSVSPDSKTIVLMSERDSLSR